MIRKFLFCLAIYLSAMVLTASVSWLFGTIDRKNENPIPSNSGERDSNIIQPRLVEIQQSEEETESNEQNETADSSESSVSPFDFQVNIMKENQMNNFINKNYFTEPPNIIGNAFQELKKRKLKICLKPIMKHEYRKGVNL